MSSNRSTSSSDRSSGAADAGLGAVGRNTQNWLLFFTGIVIGSVFLALALRNTDLSEVAQTLASAQKGWLVPLTALYLLNLGLRILRWQLMFPRTLRPSLRYIADVFFIGKLGNNFMPGRLGELVRAATLGKLAPDIGFSGAITTIVLEKILDAIVIVLLLGVALLVAPLPGWAQNAGLAMAVVFPALIVAMLAVDRVGERMGNQPGSRAWSGWTGRLRSILRDMFSKYSQGLHTLRSASNFLLLGGATTLIWTIEVVVIYICFQVFSIDAPMAAALVTIVLLSIGSMLPSAPGFIGTYQLFIVMALSLFGVPESGAFALAVFVNIYVILVTTLLGVIALVVEGGAIEFRSLFDMSRSRM